MNAPNVSDPAADMRLAERVRTGERRALAKAITLVESTRPDHRERAQKLLGELLPHSGRSLRIGISGVPGVGKSTFIEALGMYLIGRLPQCWPWVQACTPSSGAVWTTWY